ncbi:MAG: HdeD family acid-resistance protein [Planctomycetaceae bacterium]
MNLSNHPAGVVAAIRSRLFALGGGLSLLGVVSIAAPWAAATVIDWLCGGLLVLAGLLQLGVATISYSWRGFWIAAVCGMLALVGGVAMLAIPVEGVHALVTFLGIMLLVEGLVKLAAAWGLPSDMPRGWVMCDGLLNAVLGGVLVAARPAEAGVLLGLFVGMNLLSSGITFLATAAALGRAVR